MEKVMPGILGGYQFGGIRGKKAQHILNVLHDLLVRRDDEMAKNKAFSVMAFLLCIDVVKAYDSVIRSILWTLIKENFGFDQQYVK